jgi:PilZ domain
MSLNPHGIFQGPPPAGERRASRRHRPSTLAYVKVGDGNGGIVLNLSEVGLELSAAESLAREDIFSLSLQTTNRANSIDLTGRMVWLSDTKKSAGFQFVSLNDDVRNQIRSWIAQDGGDEIAPSDLSPSQPELSEIAHAKPEPHELAPSDAEPTQEEVVAPISAGHEAPEVELAKLEAYESEWREIEWRTYEAHESWSIEPESREDELAHSTSGAPTEPTPSTPILAVEEISSPGASEKREEPAHIALGVPTPTSPDESQRTGDASPDVRPAVSAFDNTIPPETIVSVPCVSASPSASLPEGSAVLLSTQAASSANDSFAAPVATSRWTTRRVAGLSGVLIVASFAIGLLVGRFPLSRAPQNQSSSAPVAEAPAQPATSSADNPADLPFKDSAGKTRAQFARPTPSPNAATTKQAAGSDAAKEGDAPLVVTPPSEGDDPAAVSLPQEAVGASTLVAISVRRSLLVPPDPGPASRHRPLSVEFGKIIAPAPPDFLPAGIGTEASDEIVRVRVTVDERGAVKDIIAIHGPTDLIEVARNMIRGWTQPIARVGGKPIEFVEDVTMNFRASK